MLAIFLFISVVMAPVVGAEPVKVRVAEGPVYGFVMIRSATGAIIAHGEVLQTLRRGLIENRLTFRFKDGSLFDETVVYSQQRVFALTSYHLIQRGPSFPGSIDVTFQRSSGQYKARLQEASDKPGEMVEGRLDLPDDVYNGMTSTLLKNVDAGESMRSHLLVFTPKPRLLTMTSTPTGEDPFSIGPVSRKATRYHVKTELGGMLGVVASLVGKDPPDLRYWIVRGPAPAFVKFEGPFYLNGPVWRVELAGPHWPK